MSPQNTTPNQPKKKLLFGCIILFLVAQFYVALNYKEPYPAILLPGFGNAPRIDKHFDFLKPKIVVTFFNGDTAVIIKEALFKGLNNEYSSSILRLKYQNVNVQGDGLTNKEISLDEKSRMLGDCKTWFQTRLREITLRSDVDWMDIRWYSYRVLFSASSQDTTGVLNSNYRINLH